MKYLVRLVLLGTLAGLLGFVGCQEKPGAAQRRLAVYPEQKATEPLIRVLLFETAASARVSVPAGYDLAVTTAAGQTTASSGERATVLRAQTTATGVQLGGIGGREIVLSPRGRAQFGLQREAGGKTLKQSFPGALMISRTSAGKLRLVAQLPVEEYLVGVLPGEMPLSYPPEALKAQAVAARSYALYQIKTRAAKPYDVFADVRSQMWTPGANAPARAKMAVNATAGLVLTENYRLFPTYFHSTCGGRTAAAKNIFAASDVTALSSRDCPNGPNSLRWRYTISKAKLSERLRQKGLGSGRVRRLRLLDSQKRELSGLGRVYFIEILTDNGVRREVLANNFRLAVGATAKEMASTYMFAEHTADAITFSGRGYGHGVGLCQTGARALALTGNDCRDILLNYYTGAVLTRVW